jgi:transposase
MRKGIIVNVTSADRARLRAVVANRNSPQKHVWRTKIILLTAEGLGTNGIMRSTGRAKSVVWRWQERFMREGVDGLLRDKTRPPGRKPLDPAIIEQVVALTAEDPSDETTHWTAGLMAKTVGISVSSVQRIWQAHGLQPHRVRRFKLSKDPEFVPKLRDIVGLYVNPPAHAIVLSVDEKSQIQALDRTQPGLPMKKGRAGSLTHDYKRHGTTTLFAALEVATGKILATHSKRRRRVEFLDFMDRLTAAFPNRQLHVILDNLSTHKKNEEWLKAHPNVKFHFTPTSASWLNQVEVWFSILQGQSLSGASFTSLKQLEQHIDAYIKAYNDRAEPFVWTKKKVRQRPFKGRRITQL